MKKTSIDNQTQQSFNESSWEQLIINGNLVISISATNADEKTIAAKLNKQIKTVHYLSIKNRPLHASREDPFSQGKPLTQEQLHDTNDA